MLTSRQCTFEIISIIYCEEGGRFLQLMQARRCPDVCNSPGIFEAH